MKKRIKPELWKPIVTEHPEPTKVYKKHEQGSFLDYQPVSERYEVPGLMPPAPRKKKDDTPR